MHVVYHDAWYALHVTSWLDNLVSLFRDAVVLHCRDHTLVAWYVNLRSVSDNSHPNLLQFARSIITIGSYSSG